MVGLFLSYKAARLLTAGHAVQAEQNAGDLWRLERLLHLPSEAALQEVVLAERWLIISANCYYAFVHFPVTALCLVWLFWRRRAVYLWARRMLAWLTAIGLAANLVLPVAPPRLASVTELLDTGTRFGPAIYGAPETDMLSNQYAAMPSLHVGWSLVVALAMVGNAGPWMRVLWLTHPMITVVVVVVTGNHFWLDAVIAVMLVGVVALAVPSSASRPARAASPPRKQTVGVGLTTAEES